MSSSNKLAEYPGLLAWYRDHAAAPPEVHQPPSLLIWRVCEALAGGEVAAAKKWLDGFRVFLATSTDALADFLAAEAICNQCDAQILDLMGALGELAIRGDCADLFLELMTTGADATGLIVLRFLAAWAALNTGRLEQCVSECEKVDEPYAAIFTLQGQALLELARPREATEVLEIAIRLSPTETLAWFQLAKARHLLGECDSAFVALRQCRQLLPNSEEVSLYMGLVALDARAVEPYSLEAFMALRPLLGRFASNPVVVFTLIKLACRIGDRSQAGFVLQGVAWQEMPSGLDTLRMLPPVLRGLHDVGWMDLAAQLLNGVTPVTSL